GIEIAAEHSPGLGRLGPEAARAQCADQRRRTHGTRELPKSRPQPVHPTSPAPGNEPATRLPLKVVAVQVSTTKRRDAARFTPKSCDARSKALRRRRPIERQHAAWSAARSARSRSL